MKGFSWRAGVCALVALQVVISVPQVRAQTHVSAELNSGYERQTESPLLVGKPLPELAGEVFTYRVVAGDSLTKIGARFGVGPRLLAQQNHLRWDDILAIGQQLEIDNHHLAPQGQNEGILINLPQRMLFYFAQGKLVRAFPVGLGKPDWQTPQAHARIVNLQENKTWYVPKSIQEEMQREGKVVVTEVPPGEDNPLGKHWIGLSLQGYGIHGTIAPASIYHFQSHGCIRLHPDDIAALFPLLAKGMPVKIVYNPVILSQLADGRVFLEVHRDVYKKAGDPLTILEQSARAQGLTDLIDWDRANAVLVEKEGLAREVGRER